MRNSYGIQHIVGESAWTLKLRKRILQIAGFNYNVLITGPTGAGKELIARAIHAHGPRSIKPFVRVNCAGLPGELFASQVFGQRRGGAKGNGHSTLGCFRAAEGGTLLLDEVGDLDLPLQEKLLRVIDEKVVTPVGSKESVPVDVRLIATTDRNLDQDVQAGRFRLDLYYRLNVISLHTVPLKDRPEDIPALARHFLARAAMDHDTGIKDLSASAINVLRAYDWPGNIREMCSLLQRAAMFSDSMTIGPECFPELVGAMSMGGQNGSGQRHENGIRAEFLDGGEPEASDHANHDRAAPMSSRGNLAVSRSRPVTDPDRVATVPLHAELASPTVPAPREAWPTLSDIERGHIARTLQETFFNQSAAARLLGINRKLLSRKMKKHGIHLPEKTA